LIDDALKRAQAAQASEQRPEPGTSPWTPAPLPDRGGARRRTALRSVAAAACLLALSAAAWLVFRGSAVTVPHSPAAKSRGLTSGAPASPADTTASAAGTSTPAPLEEVQVAPPPHGVSNLPEVLPPTAAAQPAAATSRPPAAPGPAAGPAPPDRPTGLTNGKSYRESVTLPGGARIELGGIVYSESNATAILNGKIVGPGAVIEGFLIQDIEENRVKLSNTAGLTIYIALK
jgi:hypothetical protein